MNIGINNINFTRADMPKKKEVSSAASVEETPKTPEKSKVSGSLAAAIYGIKPAQIKPQETVKTADKPFTEELSPKEKRELVRVLKRGDEQTEYMKKMIGLVNQGKVTYKATTALCENGVMSDMVRADLDTYYDKVIGQGMSVKDAFVPEFQSQSEAEEATALGDVYRVAGEERIFVKTEDKSSQQLKMDADTYLKLYPPVERFTACQGGNGDCYLLSSINSIMENPHTRATLYGCFEQQGSDIVVTLPESYISTTFENGELPPTADAEKYSTGPLGMRLLEHAFGQDLESTHYGNYTYVVDEKISKMEAKLAKMQAAGEQDEAALKKQERLAKKIEGWRAAQEKVDEAMQDPAHTLAFVLDDDGEFVIGKNGPVVKDISKIDSSYTRPSDYYTGGEGGYIDEAMQKFGFEAEYLTMEDDEESIEEALLAENPDDYIITAATHPEEEGEMESPQEESYSIYSSHAYKITPFDDENGVRQFKVTNPWNQSHAVVMSLDKVKEFFASFGIAQVNS